MPVMLYGSPVLSQRDGAITSSEMCKPRQRFSVDKPETRSKSSTIAGAVGISKTLKGPAGAAWGVRLDANSIHLILVVIPVFSGRNRALGTTAS